MDLNELVELLADVSIKSEKVLDWYLKHQEDKIWKTEQGQILKKYLGEMLKNQAYAGITCATIQIMYLNENYGDEIKEKVKEAKEKTDSDLEKELLKSIEKSIEE